VWQPNTGPQTAFLASTVREVLYGGAAGGGKSDAIIMLPFYRVHNPRHRSIILRRTRPQLQEVIDRQQAIYPVIAPGAKWQADKNRWVWPSGAITRMGYMEHEQDRFKFKSDEFDLIAFDELTSFTFKQYMFMFSRNRTKDAALPAVMRAGTNPGDVGHLWVYERFIAAREPFMVYEHEEESDVEGMGRLTLHTTRQFIPAKLADNPAMADRESYIAGLKLMGEEGEAYLTGDWSAFSGQMFTQRPKVGPPLPWSPGSMIVRAMDYGFGDPLCIYWLRLHSDGTVEVLYELYGPGMTVDVIAFNVARIERELELRPGISVASPDMFSTKDTGTGEGQSIATMLQQRGVWFERANNERVAGWARVRSLISRGLLHVREGRAPNLLRTLPNLVRDPNNPDDVKDKQEDHPAEALRYAIMAVPERNVQPQVGYVQPVQEVTEQDPVFKRIMDRLQKPGQSVIFPGLEDA
jgi:hypothetical protein